MNDVSRTHYVWRKRGAECVRRGRGVREWFTMFQCVIRSQFPTGNMAEATLEDGAQAMRFTGIAVLVDTFNDSTLLQGRPNKSGGTTRLHGPLRRRTGVVGR